MVELNNLWTHPEYQALYRAVLESPADDTPRLILADWMQEQGDERRANYIRKQIAGELAPMRLTWVLPFESVLGCQPHQCLFAASNTGRSRVISRDKTLALGFTRGFVSAVACTRDKWTSVCDKLVWRPSRLCGKCNYHAPGIQTRWDCAFCQNTGTIVTELASVLPTAQPITHVTFVDTWPNLGDVWGQIPRGVGRLYDVVYLTWYADTRDREAQFAAYMKTILNMAWPGITFTAATTPDPFLQLLAEATTPPARD